MDPNDSTEGRIQPVPEEECSIICVAAPVDAIRTQAERNAAFRFGLECAVWTGVFASIVLVFPVVAWGIFIALGYADVDRTSVSVSVVMIALSLISCPVAFLVGRSFRGSDRLVLNCLDALYECGDREAFLMAHRAAAAGSGIIDDRQAMAELFKGTSQYARDAEQSLPARMLDDATEPEAVATEVKGIARRIVDLSDLESEIRGQDDSPAKSDALSRVAEQWRTMRRRVDAVCSWASEVSLARRSLEGMQQESLTGLDRWIERRLDESDSQALEDASSAERTASRAEQLSALNDGITEVAGISRRRLASLSPP